LIFSAVRDNLDPGKRNRILDAGCGTGFTLRHLNGYGVLIGIDISETALGYCRKRGLSKIAKASVSALPFSDDIFDMVVSSDVLYHKLVEEDAAAIHEMGRVLKRGGILILHLPAHQFLWRGHDGKVHARHRYESGEVAHKLRDSSFEIIRISYRNFSLLLALLLFKFMKTNNAKGACGDLKPVWKPLNFILYFISKIENLILRKRSLSLGASVFCIARKGR
jgi:SAM-dependent methyltransferase